MEGLGLSPDSKIDNIAFKMYTNEEIDKISVLEVTNHHSLNSLGAPIDNGIYDTKLGFSKYEDNTKCKTCEKSFKFCTGHFGHINLPGPVFNPCFYNIIFKLMSRICSACFKYQVSSWQAVKFVYEMKFLDEGHSDLAIAVDDIASSISNKNLEAEEDNGFLEKSEESNRFSDPKTLNQLMQLKSKLDKMLRKSDSQGTNKDLNSRGNTSIVNTVRQQLYKKFMALNIPKSCTHCKAPLLRIANVNSQMVLTKKSKFKTNNTEKIIDSDQPYITADQCRTVFRNCYESDGVLLSHLLPLLKKNDACNPMDFLFLEKILVTPPNTRPIRLTRSIIMQHEKSEQYNNILTLSFCIKVLKPYINKGSNDLSELPENVSIVLNEFKGKTIGEKSLIIYHSLQLAIDNLLSSANSYDNKAAPRKGIKEIIEKKFGLFRQNLMGKRVNYSARSVAAPDPMLAGDEVGVPQVFAMKLTFPEYVNPYNVEKMQNLIINGPDKYPGALYVEDEEGKRVMLISKDRKQRATIANTLLTPSGPSTKKVNLTKIVYRHLQNGDLVLMNRQPTLHRPSIQAHKARVMAEDRVLRMPYVNCKAYNADFDGDELNLHFPQSFAAQSEARYLVLTHNHYLTPKDGSPLAGLIQDCVVSSVMLTKRGHFFSKAEYQQLVYVAISSFTGKISTVPPAIMKPQELWSGKQIISTILLNVIPAYQAKPTLQFKTAVKVDMWQKEPPRQWLAGGTPEPTREGMSESLMIIRDGDLLSGVIDKCAIGSTSHGLIHTCYDLYGGEVACNLLTAINRVSIEYLKWSGHTISLKEFVTPNKAARRRRMELSDLVNRTRAEVSAKLSMAEDKLSEHIEFLHTSQNEKEMAIVDAAYTSVLGPTTSRVTSENEKSLHRNNLDNNMRMMVDTGAKGSKVNMNQMASLFGSVALDGKRMPLSCTGKSLPSFKPYETDPTAGGYIPFRFVSGMDPKSYFFLCIVGRDSLQHTAVKTANSGYMQRCLIKHLEGIKVVADGTVRNSDGLVLQYEYGEDGQDVMKMPFLRNADTVNTIVNNHTLIKKDDHPYLDKKDEKKIIKSKKQITKYNRTATSKRSTPFLNFCRQNKHIKGYNQQGRSLLADHWFALTNEEKESFASDNDKKTIAPLSESYRGATTFSVVSEALEKIIDDYYNNSYGKRPLNQQNLNKKEVQEIVYKKSQISRVVPGEPVGALCAQAIGEPLTQMTLNTFHFAGRDELNVTLGVPRMIEILRTASEMISTPIMEVAFRPGVSIEAAEALKKILTPVSLSKVMHQVKVTRSLETQNNQENIWRSVIEFKFIPHREYKKIFPLNPQQILLYMEDTFFLHVLIKNIKTALKKIQNKGYGRRQQRAKNDDEMDDVENQDTDITLEKVRSIKEEQDSSDDEDKDEAENEDGGVTSSNRHNKKREQDYSDEEEEGDQDDDPKEFRPDIDEDTSHSKEDEGFFEEGTPTPSKRPNISKKKKVTRDTVDCRITFVKLLDDFIDDYSFDEENFEWCKLTLNLPIADGKYDLASILRSTITSTNIHQTANIKKAFVVPKDNCLLLKTEGVNIMKILKFSDILDINKLYTNNIHYMQKTYGIEAAQRSIIKEIRSVQSAYDIKVDFRHLSLLSDYFTCEGIYKACSRHAITSCSSIVQKMSYETCFEFLRNAVLHGDVDRMQSPSSTVMVGQPVKVGSSDIDLISQVVPSPLK